jgi:Na+-driven multidrug efflux pump
VFVSLGIVSGQWFLAENRQTLIFQRTLIGAVLNILLNIALIPKFGAAGAAIATVTTQFFVGILIDLLMNKTKKMALMKIKAFNPIKIFRLIKDNI